MAVLTPTKWLNCPNSVRQRGSLWGGVVGGKDAGERGRGGTLAWWYKAAWKGGSVGDNRRFERMGHSASIVNVLSRLVHKGSQIDD